jgi:hypothetical protein
LAIHAPNRLPALWGQHMPGAGATGCKNDRGIAESVNPRQRVAGRSQLPVQARRLSQNSPHLGYTTGLERRNEIDLPGFGTDRDRRTRRRRTDNNPCDAVENDVQTLECSAYSRSTAEDLLKDNYASLNERMQPPTARTSQLADITAK